MKSKIKIIADEDIPFLRGILEPVADISYYNGPEISNKHVKNADALIIRTRTKCNSDLLEGSAVKLIASATIGHDHIDEEYCTSRNIKWVNSPGCNSTSVMQYLASALVYLERKMNYKLCGKTIGIIGVGNVGSKISALSKILGLKVLLNDPPRARIEGSENFNSIDEIKEKSDIITFHVPLNRTGTDKTYHLADNVFFNEIKKGTTIINTSRGQVVETKALINSIRSGITGSVLIDVWENEPDIDRELLNLADIATPHIAGYSVEGKANATAICIKNINAYFELGLDDNISITNLPEPDRPSNFELNCGGGQFENILHDAILYTYNISGDSDSLKSNPDVFELLRNKYPVRREFPFYKMKSDCPDKIKNKLEKLGFNLT